MPHRRRFAAEVSDGKSDTCVAVHAVRFKALPRTSPRARDISRPSFRVELIVASSPACQGLLSLLNERKLPRSVVLEIMAFEGGAWLARSLHPAISSHHCKCNHGGAGPAPSRTTSGRLRVGGRALAARRNRGAVFGGAPAHQASRETQDLRAASVLGSPHARAGTQARAVRARGRNTIQKQAAAAETERPKACQRVRSNSWRVGRTRCKSYRRLNYGNLATIETGDERNQHTARNTRGGYPQATAAVHLGRGAAGGYEGKGAASPRVDDARRAARAAPAQRRRRWHRSIRGCQASSRTPFLKHRLARRGWEILHRVPTIH